MMNLSLATQTLSASVAGALDVLSGKLLFMQFQDSELTTEFIKNIDFLQ